MTRQEDNIKEWTEWDILLRKAETRVERRKLVVKSTVVPQRSARLRHRYDKKTTRPRKSESGNRTHVCRSRGGLFNHWAKETVTYTHLRCWTPIHPRDTLACFWDGEQAATQQPIALSGMVRAIPLH